MTKPTRFTGQREVADRGSGPGWRESDRGLARLHLERQLAKLARFLLAWLAAFLIVLALFSVFGEQLEAMSLQLRALTMSGALIIAMNFLVMPTITRVFSRFLFAGAAPETESVQ